MQHRRDVVENEKGLAALLMRYTDHLTVVVHAYLVECLPFALLIKASKTVNQSQSS